MFRCAICSVLFASTAASAISLEEFAPVHKARVEKKGANDVVLVLNSAEWSSGHKWTSSAGEDFSQAKYLAVDVENLSKTRQGRLTMHLSAGGCGSCANSCVSVSLIERNILSSIQSKDSKGRMLN